VTLTVAKEKPPPPDNCTPGYDPCLPPASDYDCAGGSGNGPAYTGLVYVDQSYGDPYGLDADGDGVGCE
jgi:resuscitation-promoting factor RpfB